MSGTRQHGLRVGFLAYNYPFEQQAGGIGTYTRVLALALKELGHYPHVILTDSAGPQHSIREGIPIHRIAVRGLARRMPFPIGRGASLLFARQLAALARSLRLDVLEAPEGTGMTAFLDLFKPRGLKTVVRLHTGHAITQEIYQYLPYSVAERAGQKLVRWAERRAIVTADAVTSVSAALVEKSQRVLRFERNDFAVFPSPVEQSFFGTRPDTPRDPGLILFVGRLEWTKGCDTLIRALPRILDAYPTARLAMVGADTQTAPGGGSMRKWLEANCAPDVWQHIEIAGTLSGGALQQRYRRASLFVLPSRWEGVPITAQEAMCCGATVVATRAGGMEEVVRDGENGVLVDPDNPGQLADAVAALLLQPCKRAELAARARQYAFQNFQPSRIVQRMLRHMRVSLGRSGLATDDGHSSAS